MQLLYIWDSLYKLTENKAVTIKYIISWATLAPIWLSRLTMRGDGERGFKLFWYFSLDGAMVILLSRELEVQVLIASSD